MGGFAAAGEGAGLDSPGARRWKLPSAAGCTTPGCGRGEGAQWGRACVRRVLARAGDPRRILEAGVSVLGWGALRYPGVETSPGRVAPGGNKGGPAGAPKAAAVPTTFALQSPFPGDPQLNIGSVQRPPGLVSPLKGGRFSCTLALPHPSAAGRPLPALQAGRGSAPSPRDSRSDEHEPGTGPPLGAALGPPWGSPERGSRPLSHQPRGFCTPREPPRGAWGRDGDVILGRSRRNQVEGGMREWGIALRGAPQVRVPVPWTQGFWLRPSLLLLMEIFQI